MSSQSPINRIVVAFDGSDMAKRAFAYAVMLAERLKCKVVALHVIDVRSPATSRVSGRMLAGDIDNVEEPADDTEAQQRIKAIDEEFEDMADYCWDRQVEFEGIHRTGSLQRELAHAVHPKDLLAVGQKGRMATADMGSMARGLIKHSPCPLLMASGELRPIMRILAAFDGSEPSLRAVRFARELASAAGLPLNVLGVGGVTWSAEETLQAAQEIAGDAQVLAIGPGNEPEAEQILRVAQHAGLAMLVMGAFPDSWLHQVLFGGTTGQVLRNLHAPVIVVH